MKSIRFLIAAGSLLLGGLRSVEAAPIYLTNTFDPVDVLFNKAGGAASGPTAPLTRSRAQRAGAVPT